MIWIETSDKCIWMKPSDKVAIKRWLNTIQMKTIQQNNAFKEKTNRKKSKVEKTLANQSQKLDYIFILVQTHCP